jgi:prepilin-type processing-associated H-X9-DG protein
MLMTDGLRGAVDYAGNGGIDGDSWMGPIPWGGPPWSITGTILHHTVAPVTIASIADGTSNTILIGERNYNKTPPVSQYFEPDENNGYIDGFDWDTIRWGYDVPVPDRMDNSTVSLQFGSSHPGVCQFVFCDGSVRSIHYGISLQVFQAVCTRQGGEVIDLDGL